MASRATAADLDLIWSEIDDQRIRTVAMLEGLTADQWDHPSLCEGWTVRHVAAHLTLQRQHVPDIVRYLARHPSVLGAVTLNRTIDRTARLQAALPTDEIITRIRAGIGSRRHNSFIAPAGSLSDTLVHAQDMAIPLGIDVDMRPTAAGIAVDHIWATRHGWTGSVFRQLPLDGYHLAATDTDWSVGSGPEITGPAAGLLLLVTGRRAGLALLDGDGAAQLKMEAQPARRHT
ncbi:maleylpyruvate isomerase family mycothiol-dependent enzyme [Terrabacter sp. 2RAF25]|uniref:maleylpyruvate isomerase family mycothiol-dependent enzyme n=1 Tax=Terrabacter sp. 2RAF25 TaxID=3232998 RepID=UPI003F9D61B7